MSVYTMITDGLHYKKGACFIRLRGIKLIDEKGQKNIATTLLHIIRVVAII